MQTWISKNGWFGIIASCSTIGGMVRPYGDAAAVNLAEMGFDGRTIYWEYNGSTYRLWQKDKEAKPAKAEAEVEPRTRLCEADRLTLRALRTLVGTLQLGNRGLERLEEPAKHITAAINELLD